MTYVSVRKSRYSHHQIKERGEFVINLTTEELAKATDFCGVKSGKNIDKYKVTGLHQEDGEFVKCKMIEESPVNLECKVTEVKEYPSHDMFIAEIVRVHADSRYFDENGRLCLDKAGMICYNHGEYFGIRRNPIGKFGYSIMKPSTRRRINREKNEARKGKKSKKRK